MAFEETWAAFAAPRGMLPADLKEVCAEFYEAGVASEHEAREEVEASILVILERQLKAKAVVDAGRTLNAIYRTWRDNKAAPEDTLTVMAGPLADLNAALEVLGPADKKLGQRP